MGIIVYNEFLAPSIRRMTKRAKTNRAFPPYEDARERERGRERTRSFKIGIIDIYVYSGKANLCEEREQCKENDPY